MQNDLRDREIDNQPRSVDQGRDQRRGQDGRVNAKTLRGDRNQRSHSRGPGTDGDYRKRNCKCQRRMLAPKQGPKKRHRSDQHSNHDADGHLAREHATGLPQTNLAQSDAANYRRYCLRSGVAAGMKNDNATTAASSLS